MKVLHVISGLGKAAGTSVFCMELCDHLQVRGVDCCIAVRRKRNDDCLPKSAVPVVEIDKNLSILPFKPDVVHIHALWDPFLHWAVVWARHADIPLVWSPHGMLAPWAMRHKRWKKWLPWFLYQKRDLRHVALFHATSKTERGWISDLGFGQACVVAPLGTQLQLCEEWHRSVAAFRNILFVGRIYPVKNLDSLIRAFSRLRGAFPNWRLLLVGPDQTGHRQELTRLADTLGLSVDVCTGLPTEGGAEVVFTGALFGAEKDAAYRKADVFVLPSHTENFGGVVADALAFGIPCVASKKTPWEEIEAEGCGFWVDNDVDGLENALRKAMSLTDEERQVMGENGRRLVERKYQWSAIAEQMKTAYEWVLGEGEKPGWVWEE
jgi:glycosyltransferase involved in cell wall biosynthesis